MSAPAERNSWSVNVYWEGTLPHPARLELAEGKLVLSGESGEHAAFEIGDGAIVSEPDAAGRGALRPHPNADLRVAFNDPAIAETLRRMPVFGRAASAAARAERATMARWIAGAVSGLALLLFVVIPVLADRIATAIPTNLEIAAGATMAAQTAALVASGWSGDPCRTAEGREEFDGMVARLAKAANPPYPIVARVVRAQQVNAYALPGGQILVLAGLIDFVDTPEELAGVLAHEIAHVERRDPTRGLIRSAAIGAVLGFVFGDTIVFSSLGAVGAAVIGVRYSQADEAAADARAIEILREANIDTAGLAAFFARHAHLAGPDESGVDNFLSTHPVDAERARRAKEAPPPDEVFPAMSDKAWQNLRAACRR